MAVRLAIFRPERSAPNTFLSREDLRRAEYLRGTATSLVLLSNLEEEYFRETHSKAFSSLQPPVPPEHVARSRRSICLILSSIPAHIKASAYCSLLSFLIRDLRKTPKNLTPRLRDFFVSGLQYNAEEDEGKKGEPPSVDQDVYEMLGLAGCKQVRIAGKPAGD
jgi:hypothetical protein